MNRGMSNAVGTVMFAIAALAIFTAGASAQSIRYVDTGGSDTTDCTAAGSPCLTIQYAIDQADPGDTIQVADGTYTENVDIDKEDLTVVSVNGAAATTIVGADDGDPLFPILTVTPAVQISADGITLGDANQGFTIEQQDLTHPGNHSGDASVKVLGDVVDTGSVTIQNNTLVGNDTDEGILINPNIEGGHLIVQNNTFEQAVGADFSFKDAVHFHWVAYVAPIFDNLAAHTATIDLLNNDATDFGRSAVYFHGVVYNSTVNINPSSFSPEDTPFSTTYGVYFNDDISALSTVNISETTIIDPRGNTLAATTVNGEVTIQRSAAGPGPSETRSSPTVAAPDVDLPESGTATGGSDRTLLYIILLLVGIGGLAVLATFLVLRTRRRSP